VSRVDVSVATITKIGVDIVAVTVPVVATSLIPDLLITLLSNAARDLTVGGGGGAGNDGLEVAGVPVVESVAVLGVLAKLGVALANINEVRGLGRHESVISAEIIDKTALPRSIKILIVGLVVGGELDVRLSLGELPGVARRRATTTTAGGLHDSARTDLVRLTIRDVIVVLKIPLTEGLDIIKGGTEVLGVLDAVHALGGAGRPVRPLAEHAVLLEALELVGALNARLGHGRADTDFIEGGLDEGDTKDVLEIGLLSEATEVGIEGVIGSERVEVSGVLREDHTVNLEPVTAIVGELGIPTTVIGGLGGVARASLDGDVAEDADLEVPEVTALVRVGALSPSRPLSHLNVEAINIWVRPLLVGSSLTTVVEVVIVVLAAGKAVVLRGLADPVILVVILNAIPRLTRTVVAVAVSELVELTAVDAVITAVVLVTNDGDATVALAVRVTLLALVRAETGSRNAEANSVVELIEALDEVSAIASDDTRLVVLPGKGAVTVGVLPRKNGVRELSGGTELGINRAEIAVNLAAVLRIVVAIEPALLALVEAVSGPAVLVAEVVDGVPEREVTTSDAGLLIAEAPAVVIVPTIAVRVNPGDVLDILGPVATVANGPDTISTEVDVLLRSRSAKESAVVR